MKSLRLFFPQENVCTSMRGSPPAWNKTRTHHKGRPHRLVSHPVNHLFRIADKCDRILMQDVYWYWKKRFALTPAMMCWNGVLVASTPNFEGANPEMCATIWETIRQQRFYLGEITSWTDATKDAELFPFDPVSEDATNAALLPAPLIEIFLTRPSCFTLEDFEDIRCAL